MRWKRGKRNNNPFVSSTECILQLFNASNEGAINLDIFFSLDGFIWLLPFICRPCFVPCAFCISRKNTYVCIDVENILNTNVYFICGSMCVCEFVCELISKENVAKNWMHKMDNKSHSQTRQPLMWRQYYLRILNRIHFNGYGSREKKTRQISPKCDQTIYSKR